MLALAAACTGSQDRRSEAGPRPAGDTWTDTASDSGGGGTGDTSTDTGGDAPAPACSSWADPVEGHAVDDAELSEISGLVISEQNPGWLWVLEDQPSPPVLTAIDEHGATIGTLTLETDAVDWEALALGPCDQGTCLWVGDIGDNLQERDTVSLVAVPEPVLVGASSFALTLTPTVYPLAYPDGPNNAEGLAITPDGLPVIVTKRTDGLARVMAPAALDASTTVDLVEVAEIVTGDPADTHAVAATAADITPDGGTLLVRTYGHVLSYSIDGATLGEPVELPAADELQGESIAWDAARRGYWQVSEGIQPSMWFTACADGS